MNKENLISICEFSMEWKDVPFSYINSKNKHNTVIIPLMFTGSNGVYVFFDDLDVSKEIDNISTQLHAKLNMRSELFLFISSEDAHDGFFYDDGKKELIKLEEFEVDVENFYFNHLIPQAELHHVDLRHLEDYFQDTSNLITIYENDERYIRPTITQAKLDDIDDRISKMQEEGYIQGNYIIYPDGSMRVIKKYFGKHGVFVGISSSNGYDSFSFPCDDEDGDKTFLITLLGGWFGLHKFRHRKWGQGLTYLLTCGVGGIFYFFDLLNLLMGGYFDTVVEYDRDSRTRNIVRKEERIYARPIRNKIKWLVTLPLSLLLSLLLLNFAYQPVYSTINKTISNVVVSYTQNHKDNTFVNGLVGMEEWVKMEEEATNQGN